MGGVALIEDHVRATGTRWAPHLDNWEMMVALVKVLPLEYKRVLAERRAQARPDVAAGAAVCHPRRGG